MATISTDTADARVDMSNPLLVQFLSQLIAQPGLFAWTAPLGSTFVQIYGSGFTYSGSGDARDLSGGSIAGVDLDINPNNSVATVDLAIFGLTDVVASAIDKEDPRSFWAEILKGKDTFHLGGLDEDLVGLGPNVIFGDDLASATVIGSAISDRGARDIIHGGDNQFDLIGDVLTVAGDSGSGQFARYAAGRDKIDSGGIAGGETDRQIRMSGDASSVGYFAVLRGGDDKLGFSGFSGAGFVAGDALELNAGRVNGGDDSIVMRLVGGASLPEVAGDVLLVTGQAQVNGGDDIIRIVGIGALVGGDVYEVAQSSPCVINGGADQLVGSDERDMIAGDVAELDSLSSTVNGGADLIDGGAGDDLLLGEAATGFTVAFETDLAGGNDTIYGGRGDDDIFGQTGDDQLFGGDGKDEISGGSGDDIAEGGEGADIFYGGRGRDSITGGAGKDQFVYYITSDSGPTNADRDRISDFAHGQERLDLSRIDAIEGGGASNDAFTFIGSDPFLQAGQIRAVQSGADTLIQMNTLGASVAEMSILLVGIDASTITAADFVL